MPIEYTYPERPKDAKVDSATGIYFMRRNEPGEVVLNNHIVRDADVPEVCEAMMTLAGHEWPVVPIQDVMSAAAERIIARLNGKARATSKHDLAIVELPDAIAIVREECGVAE